MSSRRSFLQQSGIAAAAAFLSQSAIATALANTTSAAGINKIGIQLYTLRELLAKDVKSVISNLNKIGYTEVETFYGYAGPNAAKGFWGLDAKEFKSLLNDNNIVTPSGHYNVNEYLVANGTDDILKSHIETAATVGQKYFAIPGLPENVRKTGSIDDYKAIAEKFNKAAELCKAYKLKLGYHNHNFEFNDLGDGLTGYKILLKETDPATVSFELDLFWAINAGLDPIQLFKQNPGRYKMWHVKDMDKSNRNVFTEVGTGSIDFKPIFAEAKLAGLTHIFVEQDVIKIDPYNSITQSFNFIKGTLLK